MLSLPGRGAAASPDQPSGKEPWMAGETGAGTDGPQLLLAGPAVAVPLLRHDLPHDDVTVELHSQSGSLQGLYLVPVLVLRIHCHELEQHEVEQGGNDGQPEHDEDQHEGHVLGRLQMIDWSHLVTPAWSHLITIGHTCCKELSCCSAT